MDVNELIQQKRRIEEDLTELIRKRLEQFEDETGFTPETVQVNLSKLTSLTHRRSRFIVRNVEIEISL